MNLILPEKVFIKKNKNKSIILQLVFLNKVNTVQKIKKIILIKVKLQFINLKLYKQQIIINHNLIKQKHFKICFKITQNLKIKKKHFIYKKIIL